MAGDRQPGAIFWETPRRRSFGTGVSWLHRSAPSKHPTRLGSPKLNGFHNGMGRVRRLKGLDDLPISFRHVQPESGASVAGWAIGSTFSALFRSIIFFLPRSSSCQNVTFDRPRITVDHKGYAGKLVVMPKLVGIHVKLTARPTARCILPLLRGG